MCQHSLEPKICFGGRRVWICKLVETSYLEEGLASSGFAFFPQKRNFELGVWQGVVTMEVLSGVQVKAAFLLCQSKQEAVNFRGEEKVRSGGQKRGINQKAPKKQSKK